MSFSGSFRSEGIEMAMKKPRLAALKSSLSGTPIKGVLPANQSIDAVWQHITEGLEALAANGQVDQVELNENALTQRLFDELQGIAGFRPFYFHKEFMQDESTGKSPRADLAVLPGKARPIVVNSISYAWPKPFLTLEAKRLPTPGHKREREYLIGDGGGVARFKLGDYAPQMTEVGLIGYVQRHSFEYWLKQINEWVDELMATTQVDLPWDVLDKLKLEAESKRLARLRSDNVRVSDKKRVTIRHLWVQLANEATAAG